MSEVGGSSSSEAAPKKKVDKSDAMIAEFEKRHGAITTANADNAAAGGVAAGEGESKTASPRPL